MSNILPFDKDIKADEELRELSPLLHDLRPKIVDTNEKVPEKYFDDLADSLWAKLEAEELEAPKSKLRAWYRAPFFWSAAAAVLLTFAVSAYLFLPNNVDSKEVIAKANKKSNYDQLLAEIDQGDIEAYLLENIDDIDLSAISLSAEGEADLTSSIYSEGLLDEAQNYQATDEYDDY